MKRQSARQRRNLARANFLARGQRLWEGPFLCAEFVHKISREHRQSPNFLVYYRSVEQRGGGKGA